MELPDLFPNDPMQLLTIRGYSFSEMSSAMKKPSAEAMPRGPATGPWNSRAAALASTCGSSC